jgi:hypothetical protein
LKQEQAMNKGHELLPGFWWPKQHTGKQPWWVLVQAIGIKKQARKSLWVN